MGIPHVSDPTQLIQVRAFGLCLHSSLPFHGLPAADGQADVLLVVTRLVPPPLAPGTESDSLEGRFSVQDGEAWFVWPSYATVRVRGGERIEVDPVPGVDPHQLQAGLLGPVFSVLLLQRGLLPLHAAALEIEGRAVAFAATSGGGKSTLAATLGARGHAFLSDDVTAVELEGEQPRIRASYPLMKLTPRSQQRLGRAGEDAPLVNPDEDKRAFDVRVALPEGSRAFDRLYVIEDGERVAIEPIARGDALFLLLRHSHRSALLHHAAGAAEMMRRCARVAERVPLYRLRRPFDLARLDELALAIERHVAPERPA